MVNAMIDQFSSLAKTFAAVALVGLAVSRVYRPRFSRPGGTVIRQIRLPLAARLRLHSLWLLGVGTLLVTAAAPQVEIGIVPLTIMGAGMLALISMPVCYTIRHEGIQVGRTPVRRWTEFAGLSARNGWIHLKPVSGGSGLIVRSPGGPDGEVLLGELRGLFRLSYKGESSHGAPDEAMVGTESALEVLEGSVA